MLESNIEVDEVEVSEVLVDEVLVLEHRCACGGG